MPNKANKSSKKVKSPTANVEVNPLPKEPHSALAVVAVVVAAVAVVQKRRVLVVQRKRVQAKRVVQRVRVQAKTIRLQSTGSKST